MPVLPRMTPLAVSGFFLQEDLNMAWWTHLIFFRDYLGNPGEDEKEESIFAVFRRAIRQYLYENFLFILSRVLTFFTYGYLTLAIVAFFFENDVPPLLPYLVDIFAEPYLGVLGIYVVIREVKKRRGIAVLKLWGELFAALWVIFCISASLALYFSAHYHTGEIYKTIVTTTFAALIIRIGTFIR